MASWSRTYDYPAFHHVLLAFADVSLVQVKNWQQEMEDLQLEKQIESLRRELEEAKTGAFVKATARMDAMQQDMDDLRGVIVNSQGQVQVCIFICCVNMLMCESCCVLNGSPVAADQQGEHRGD